MKKIFSLSALLCLFVSVSVYAQRSPVLLGRIMNKENQPVISASISLLKAKDSSEAGFSLSDKEGKFRFENLPPDSFFLSVSHVGFVRTTTAKLIVKQGEFVLPVIILQPEKETALQEVVVSAKKPFIEQQIDRTVVNVDALITATGTNALELLEKAPGVIVDQNGNISLKGKSGVLVLIDDRPTYLSAADLATYLRSVPSSSIEKIELMTNPPSKYDAASAAGVIIIRTKKLKTRGFNGVISSSVGEAVYARTSHSLNLNYRSGPMNVFGNFSYNLQNNWRRLEMERQYFSGSGTIESVFSQVHSFKTRRESPYLKAGLDYDLSRRTTAGLVFTGSFSNTSEWRPVTTQIFDSALQLDSLIAADNKSKSNFSSKSLNLNLRHRFDSTDRQLSVDLDYVNYGSGNTPEFINSSYDGQQQFKYREIQTADLPATISIYSAKADYQHTTRRAIRIETGLKTSYVDADNEARYFFIQNGEAVSDINKTNHFLYRENIRAAYLSASRDFKRLALKAGLRFENTWLKGHQLGNSQKPDSSFSQNYSQLFPTAYISYKLDSTGKNTFSFSYGRRIRRPYYQDLNPFIFLQDKFSWFAGNPYLKPQYLQNLELSWHFKSRLTVTLMYNYATNLQKEIIEQAGDIFISRTGNIGRRIFMGISTNATLKPFKFWTSNIYSELVNNRDKAMIASNALQRNTLYWYVNANNQFAFEKGWSAELSGFFITDNTDAQFRKEYVWVLNAGIQKKLLKNKFTVKLTATDLFRSLEPRGTITDVTGTNARFHNYFDSRAIIAGLSYSFGKSFKTSRRNSGSVDEEQGRIKN
jgi:hypothetical protein